MARVMKALIKKLFKILIALKHIITEVKFLLARGGHLHVECVVCLVRLCSLQLAKVLYTKAGPYAGPTFAVRRSLTRTGLPNPGPREFGACNPSLVSTVLNTFLMLQT